MKPRKTIYVFSAHDSYLLLSGRVGRYVTLHDLEDIWDIDFLWWVISEGDFNGAKYLGKLTEELLENLKWTEELMK